MAQLGCLRRAGPTAIFGTHFKSPLFRPNGGRWGGWPAVPFSGAAFLREVGPFPLSLGAAGEVFLWELCGAGLLVDADSCAALAPADPAGGSLPGAESGLFLCGLGRAASAADPGFPAAGLFLRETAEGALPDDMPCEKLLDAEEDVRSAVYVIP